jgi:hypothetical protein
MAVRAAVGASRTRLVRQLLVETSLLFLLGAAAGLVVASMLTRLVPLVLTALPFPVVVPAAIDVEAIAVATALAFVAAVLSGLAPAAQAARTNLGTAMNADRHQSRGVTLRRTFVMAQVALSVVLVVVGGLFVRAMLHAGAWAPGFDARGVELVSLNFATDEAAAAAAQTPWLEALISRVSGIPGVERVSATSSFPGGFEEMRLGALRVTSGGREADDGDWNVVAPGYFQTIRMPMLAGRDFRATDRAGTSRVVIIGEATVHRLWPGRPVAAAVGESGEHIAFNPTTGRFETTPVVVVGVVGDPAYGTLIDGRNDIHVYMPMAQMRPPRTMLAVRTTDGRSAANEIRAALADGVRGLTVGSTRSAEEYSLLGLLPQRVGAFVTAALGLVGLLLATIGVYGVPRRRSRNAAGKLAFAWPSAHPRRRSCAWCSCTGCRSYCSAPWAACRSPSPRVSSSPAISPACRLAIR